MSTITLRTINPPHQTITVDLLWKDDDEYGIVIDGTYTSLNLPKDEWKITYEKSPGTVIKATICDSPDEVAIRTYGGEWFSISPIDGVIWHEDACIEAETVEVLLPGINED